MSLLRQPRSFYITVITLLILLMASSYFLLQDDDEHYAVLVGSNPSGEILEVFTDISKPVETAQQPEKIVPEELDAKGAHHGSVLKGTPIETKDQFFTIQLMSFSQLAPALREFDRVVKKMVPGDFDNLRVEQIQNYFTVRGGKFDSRQEAEMLRKVFFEAEYKDAFVLSAYIIPSRIKKIFSPTVILDENKKLIDSSKDKVTGVAGDIVEEEDEKTPSAVKPEAVETVQPSPVEVPPAVDEVPAKVTFSFEVVTVLYKDDKGESLRMPSGLFFDDLTGELYIINGANNRIVVYGSDYFPQNSLGKERGLDSPLSGTLDDKGNVFVAQTGTPSSSTRLTVLNAAFLPEREIFLEGIPESDGFIFQRIAVAKNGLLYATGLKSDKVLVLETSGAFKKWLYVPVDKKNNYVFTELDSEAEIKAVVKDVVIDSLDNHFLLSEENSRVYVFSPDDKFLFSFGTKGGAQGKMSRPRGLVIDEKKRCFYLVDYMRHTILVYDFTGAFRFEFGGKGWGPEWFNFPVDIELGPQGQVIVADFFNQRVQVFETTFSGPLPQKPQGMWTVAEK